MSGGSPNTYFEECKHCSKVLRVEEYFDHLTDCKFAPALNNGTNKVENKTPEKQIEIPRQSEVELDATYIPSCEINYGPNIQFESIGSQDEVEFVGESSATERLELEEKNYEIVIPPRPAPRRNLVEATVDPPHAVPSYLREGYCQHTTTRVYRNTAGEEFVNTSQTTYSPRPSSEFPRNNSEPSQYSDGQLLPYSQPVSSQSRYPTHPWSNPLPPAKPMIRPQMADRMTSPDNINCSNRYSQPFPNSSDTYTHNYNLKPSTPQPNTPFAQYPATCTPRVPPGSDVSMYNNRPEPTQFLIPNQYGTQRYPSEFDTNHLSPGLSKTLIMESDTTARPTQFPQHLDFSYPTDDRTLLHDPVYSSQIRTCHNQNELLPIHSQMNRFSDQTNCSNRGNIHSPQQDRNLFHLETPFNQTCIRPQMSVLVNQTHISPSQTHIDPAQYIQASQTHIDPAQYIQASQTYIQPNQTHIPPNQTYIPPNQTYMPTSQTHIPPSQTYMPPDQTYTQTSQTYMPPDQTYTQTSQTYRPTSQTHMPHSQTHMPPDQTHMPTSQTHMPHSQTHMPHSQTYMPHSQTHMPPNQTHMPHSQTYMPTSQTHMPHSQTYMPHSQTHMPHSQTHMPTSQTHMPHSQTHMPTSQTKIDPSKYLQANQAYEQLSLHNYKLDFGLKQMNSRPNQSQPGFYDPEISEPSPLRCQIPQLRDKPSTAPHLSIDPPSFLPDPPEVPKVTSSLHEENPSSGIPFHPPLSMLPPGLFPPPYNPSYVPEVSYVPEPEVSVDTEEKQLMEECKYCHKEFESAVTRFHMADECPLNPEVAKHLPEGVSELYANYSEGSHSSSDSDDCEQVACQYCGEEFTTVKMVEHYEKCETRLAICSLSTEDAAYTSNEFESGLTLPPETTSVPLHTLAEPESLEAVDQVCRKCNGIYTLSGLKQHAEDCCREQTMDMSVPLQSLNPMLGVDTSSPPGPELPPRKRKPRKPTPFPRMEGLVDLTKETESMPIIERAISPAFPLLPTPVNPDMFSVSPMAHNFPVLPMGPMGPMAPNFPELPMGPMGPMAPTFSVSPRLPLLFTAPKIESEKEKCPVCRKKFPVEEMPSHVEECRDREEGECPNCKETFLITTLPDHTEKCKSGKTETAVVPVFSPPKPLMSLSIEKSDPQKYGRCHNCLQDVLSSGHKCRDNYCGLCYSDIDPREVKTHRIQCLRSQTSAYTEINRRNWVRCLSCLIDIPPEDYETHTRDCDDLLLGDITRYKKFTPNLEDIDWATAALTREQRAAMDHVVENAKILSDAASPKLADRVVRLGFTIPDLDRTLKWISFEAPIIIHVFLEKLIPLLLKDSQYRNQFETGTSHGSRDLTARKRWEDNIFNNVYRNCNPTDRVKYGVLNIVGDICGVKCCKQYGDSYFILKKVRLRTSFASADSSNSRVKIASCEHYEHVLSEYTDGELTAILTVASKKKPFMNSDVIQQYKEVQIHGPVDLSEHVDCIVANQRHKGDVRVEGQLQEFISKNNCNMIWMD